MPDLPEEVAARIALAYAEAEADLLAFLARRAAAGKHTGYDEWAAAKASEARALRRAAQARVGDLEGVAARLLSEAVEEGYQAGRIAAGAPAIGGRPDAVRRLAQATVRQTVPRSVFRILRDIDDAYRLIQAEVATRMATGTITLPQAVQRSLDRYADRGITGFIDTAGRGWGLQEYAEMSTRTATSRALIEGRLDAFREQGRDLVIVSDSPENCPVCAPWEGQILGIDGPGWLEAERRSVPSVSEATAAGLFHPNAVLGDQAVTVLGRADLGVRAWYSGPSIDVTTARGNRFTVSPNHPVLTAAGWLPAHTLSEGLEVFSAPPGRGSEMAVADKHLNHMESSVEEILDALTATGGAASAPSAGDHFDDDRRFVEGEIDVVGTERPLLGVLDPHRVEVPGERGLPLSDVESPLCPRHRPSMSRLRRVGAAVGGSLSDRDPRRLQPSENRFPADRQRLGDILRRLAVPVSADRISHIDVGWYRGHAYDLQTSSGAYQLDSVIIHNCTHILGAYIPGLTRPMVNTENPVGYELRQTQRYHERQVRRWKRRDAVGVTPEAKAYTQRYLAAARGRYNRFITDNDRIPVSWRTRVF